jgi:O-acetyl-ADP-ribose deacetylase (regulator of RNase III)
MIEEVSGDLLSAEVDALVNAVNTVGVMGKGLALAMFMFDNAPRTPSWIINFPTKRHWRDSSRLEDVRVGLVDLLVQVQRHAIGSLALPALGCGLGGLDWADVRPMVIDASAKMANVRVLVFAPQGTSKKRAGR